MFIDTVLSFLLRHVLLFEAWFFALDEPDKVTGFS